MNEWELLDILIRIGRAMTVYGAETYRVEDSLKRICAAYGHTEAEIFAVPSYIEMTVICKDGTPVTRSCRIKYSEANLGRLDRYNSLSRYICRTMPSYEKVISKIELTEKSPEYPRFMMCFGSFAAGAAFSLLFGGNWKDAAAAAMISGLIYLIGEYLDKIDSGTFMRSICCSAVLTMLAVFSSRIGFTAGFDKVIIGGIMVLVPGVTMTNCMRDFLAGDYISGMYRLAEALLDAAGIAVGSGIVVAAVVTMK